MLDALFDRFRRGDRLALARLLSLISKGDRLYEIESRLQRVGCVSDSCDKQRSGSVSDGEPKPVADASGSLQRSRVVAFTGSGGVGKSTLIGKLIVRLREQGKKVAVLACDPQSPLSGGALLGDRFRMPTQPDDGIYIRSLAAPSGQGAIAGNLALMIRLLESFGFDYILIETVGAGQGDTAVHELADVVVLLLQPEMGDDLQWEKAGICEVADIVAIHKADLPGTDNALAQIRSMLSIANTRDVPILRVSARTGEGIDALLAAIESAPLRARRKEDSAKELVRAVQRALTIWCTVAQERLDPDFAHLIDQWRQGNMTAEEASLELVLLWVGSPSPLRAGG